VLTRAAARLAEPHAVGRLAWSGPGGGAAARGGPTAAPRPRCWPHGVSVCGQMSRMS